jgi:uncharacterized membrane protein
MSMPGEGGLIGMPPGRPSVGAAISWSFATFRRHPVPFISLAAVVAVIQMVQQVATGPIQNIMIDCSNPQSPGQQAACEAALGTGSLLAITTAVGVGLLATVATIGVYQAALRATVGQAPSFSDLYTSQYIAQYVLVTLATLGLTIVGLLLCCLPGLLVVFFLQLAPFYVLDRGPGVRASIMASTRAIRANASPAVVLLLFTFLVTALGGTLYGVLTLLTLPFAALVTAHMYRQFNGQAVVSGR